MASKRKIESKSSSNNKKKLESIISIDALSKKIDESFTDFKEEDFGEEDFGAKISVTAPHYSEVVGELIPTQIHFYKCYEQSIENSEEYLRYASDAINFAKKLKNEFEEERWKQLDKRIIEVHPKMKVIREVMDDMKNRSGLSKSWRDLPYNEKLQFYKSVSACIDPIKSGESFVEELTTNTSMKEAWEKVNENTQSKILNEWDQLLK